MTREIDNAQGQRPAQQRAGKESFIGVFEMNPVDFAEALRSCTENGADPEILFGAAEEIDRLRAIEAAARNLVKVKGRHHAETAYQNLVEALK